MANETTALYAFQTIDTATLAAFASGQIDANELARRELANRGLSQNGEWVGFKAAAAELQVAS